MINCVNGTGAMYLSVFFRKALIAINTLVTLPTAVINTAITSLIPDLASPQQRGQVVSVRWLILSAVATVAALVGGQILDLMPVPLNYQVLLGVGTALSLLSLHHLRRIRVPDVVLAQRREGTKWRFAWRQLRQSLANVRAHRDFVRFTTAAFVFYWGIYLPAALWSVLRVRDLGASDTWIGVIALVVNASTIVGISTGARWLPSAAIAGC